MKYRTKEDYDKTIRYPYNKKTKSGGEPLIRDAFASLDKISFTNVHDEVYELKVDYKYVKEALDILNRDVGYAHSKIRKINGWLLKLAVAAIIGMAGVIVKLAYMLLERRLVH